MDKTQCINTQVRSQQGFALMITLSVLSIIIALTMVLLSYFEEVQQDASDTKALIQADLYYKDITTIFDAISGEQKKTIFGMIYRIPLPLKTKKEKFSLMLQCEPLSKGININWLGLQSSDENDTRSNVAHEVFDLLAQEYSIVDAGRLLEMIYEETGNSNKFITKEQSRLHQKNGIISYQQFADIVSRYQFEVDDPEIGKIPWKKYFSFYPGSKKIDGEYSAPELIATLFEIDISLVQDWISSVEESLLLGSDPQPLEAFVASNGGDYAERKALFAGKEFLDQTACSVRYALGGAYYRFAFEYIEGEAKYFEFYGKQ